MSAELKAHEGKLVSNGHSDHYECSCGWESMGYFDGAYWAEQEWEEHALASRTPTEAEPGEAEVAGLLDKAQRGLQVAMVASCDCDHEANISPEPAGHTNACRYRVLYTAASALADAIAALRSTPNAVEGPMLTADEEAELVERINGNPNLHPAVAVDDDAELLREVATWDCAAPDASRILAIADRLQSLLAPKEGSHFQAMKAASDEIASLQASVRVKDEALTKCREKFADYASQHEAKARAANPGGSSRSATGEAAERWEKVTRNLEMVAVCDAALSDQQGQPNPKHGDKG